MNVWSVIFTRLCGSCLTYFGGTLKLLNISSGSIHLISVYNDYLLTPFFFSKV